MADYINDKELEEINEIYRQKLEAQKHKKSDKKPKREKTKPDENEDREERIPDKKSDKSEKKDKPEENDKPAKTDNTRHIDVSKSADAENSEKRKKRKDPDKKPVPEKTSDSKDDKTKRLGYKINIGVCATFFAVVVVCLLVLPRPTVSESEKRELAKFPEFSWGDYWSGKYTSDISNFFNDTVPFRDEFKQLGANFRTLFGFSLNGATLSGDIQNVNSGSSQTEVTTQSTKPIAIVTPAPSTDSNTPDSDAPASSDNSDNSDNSKPADTASGSSDNSDSSAPESDTSGSQLQFTAPSDPDAEIIYEEGTQLVYRSNGTLYAGALYNGRRDYAEDYAASLNSLCEQLPGVNLYSMTALTQNTFITPSELNTGTYTERADTQYIANMLSGDIKVIDTMEALLPHKDEDIFFLRDCHWQQLGAYYAAESLAKAAGVPFADLSSYEKYEEDCLGSVYINTKYDGLMYEGETFTYYVPQNDFSTEYYNSAYEYQFDYPLMPQSDYKASSFYSLFMVADSYIKHITTDVGNGRVLVVVKDDYPSAMVPCLTSSFEEIYVIDARYCDFNLVDFCQEKGATDVFVGMTVENALSDFGTYLDYIMNL